MIEPTLGEVMADREMSLNELSGKVGVAPVNLSRLKCGHAKAIRLSLLDALCEVLDCQPGDLLRYVEEAGVSRSREL